MKIVSSEQMKSIEKKSMNKNSIRSIILMENAARGVVENCKDEIERSESIIVFCGSGNNGGDGFAVARLIYIMNKNVKIIFVGNYDKMTPDCFENAEIAKKMGIEISTSFSDYEIKNADLIIDAIIGTGLKNTLRPNYIEIIDKINKNSKYTVSIDCPTGINSDNGSINGISIKADKTITFYLPKIGLYLYPAREYTGIIKTAEIGIFHENDEEIKSNILTLNEAKKIMPKRLSNSHKGTFGCVCTFTGSREMAGACCFAAKSAYNVGCGLVKAYVVSDILSTLQNNVPEAVTSIVPDKNGFFCEDSLLDDFINKDKKVILAGCGIGNNADTAKFIYKLIENATSPIIFDADALNVISKNVEMLHKIKGECIITPHIKEMSRLTGLSTSEILNSPIETAVAFAKKYNVTVVLKSASTIISSPNGDFYINTTGNSSMAKGGSGDCLAGTIAGLLAQNLSPLYSASLGSFINGLSAETASENLSLYGVCARDIISFIPTAIKKILM